MPFFSILFKSNLLLLLFSCPTAGPDGAGACALKLALIYARRREAGGGEGKWDSKGNEDTGHIAGLPVS